MLGIVWRDGPCTAYQVRRSFLDSPSSHWSGSAGAIYPLVRRLEAAGLLKGDSTAGPRGDRRFRLTASGRRALERWLAPPLPESDVAHAFDPIRTRLFFLSAVGPARQRALLDEAIARLVEHERVIEADCKAREAAGDRDGYLGALGVLLTHRARIAWLRQVRKRVTAP